MKKHGGQICMSRSSTRTGHADLHLFLCKLFLSVCRGWTSFGSSNYKDREINNCEMQ